MTTPCSPERLKRAAKKAAAAKAKYSEAAALVRYMNDDNGGWGTPLEHRKARMRRDRAQAKSDRAEVAFKSVLRCWGLAGRRR